MTRSAGSGYVHQLIVSAILGGAKSTDQIGLQLKSHIAGVGLIRVLKRMESKCWLGRNARGWFVLDAGRRCLPHVPSAPLPWQMTVYRPPVAPPRRPGSDWSWIPSVVSENTLQEYRRHV